ncbi:DnaJ domain containing protein [Theileria equi strain WA]|uniref:DnaJ domain containing protein n=1 Tax=Theileria equi strain WA TaxID=1537102 RepID=L1LA02_THEEQ|nr:DnaJ domain containing protein [Theileria equi strain WA]EKX72030.1 DnaJ domain containing protein [Theileria equi strain WA]|eukprot:XP_004831482.1 DnaJ domain containing protein [Theileria equi strain WA]
MEAASDEKEQKGDEKEVNDGVESVKDEENEAKNDKTAESAEKPEEKDEILSLFFSEIESIGKVQSDDTNIKFNAKELCLRLTSRTFSSPFQVLQLKHDATEEEIKQRYRKMSLLIHPDKFKHENARQAFQVLTDAYNEIQKEDTRDKYKAVYGHAKAVVYKRHKLKLNSTHLDLIASGLLDSDLQKIDHEIQAECEKMLKRQTERREYAEKCIQANIDFEKQMAAEQIELEKQKLNEQVEWDKTRDLRVNSWRSFQSKVDSKEFKLGAFKGIETKREARNELDLESQKNSIAASKTSRQNKKKKILEEHVAYRSNWR